MHKESTILLSTAYLPPIEYMALLLNYDNIIIEKEETYPKQTYRNRSKIMTANGVLNLPIPVNKTNGNNTKISKITISNTDLWYINHWRAINSAYSGSPFFLYYKDNFIKFYSGEYRNLLEFNTELTKLLLSLIGIKCNVSFSDSFTVPDTNSQDFRYTISPKKENNKYSYKKYVQVFSNKFEFVPNLSIIDLLFNLGPETKDYLGDIIR